MLNYFLFGGGLFLTELGAIRQCLRSHVVLRIEPGHGSICMVRHMLKPLELSSYGMELALKEFF